MHTKDTVFVVTDVRSGFLKWKLARGRIYAEVAANTKVVKVSVAVPFASSREH